LYHFDLFNQKSATFLGNSGSRLMLESIGARFSLLDLFKDRFAIVNPLLEPVEVEK
jgi:hypothetical protein